MNNERLSRNGDEQASFPARPRAGASSLTSALNPDAKEFVPKSPQQQQGDETTQVRQVNPDYPPQPSQLPIGESTGPTRLEVSSSPGGRRKAGGRKGPVTTETPPVDHLTPSTTPECVAGPSSSLQSATAGGNRNPVRVGHKNWHLDQTTTNVSGGLESEARNRFL